MQEMQHQPPMQLQTNEERQMGMFLHLAGLLNAIGAFPLGAIATILIWQLKKEEMPALDSHGKMATNWLISFFIYALISFFLIFILVGILLLPVVAIIGIIFPIIAGIKANNGEYWEYPLTIKFLK